MRRFLLFFVVMLSGIGMIFAQSGQKLSYQAVIRNSANQLVTNTQLEVTIGIANSENGAAVYTEHHTVTTNANGLISLMIGTGDNRTGDWGQIEWEHAYVTTNTVVDGVPVTHKVELTAVAHAFYADNVDEEMCKATGIRRTQGRMITSRTNPISVMLPSAVITTT